MNLIQVDNSVHGGGAEAKNAGNLLRASVKRVHPAHFLRLFKRSYSPALVSRLFKRRSPTTISRLIISAWIGVSVKRFANRPQPHVLPEIDVLQPRLTDNNPKRAISRVAAAGAVGATLNHAIPGGVGRSPVFTMLEATSPSRFAQQTPAGLHSPGTQGIDGGYCAAATHALAVPQEHAPSFCLRAGLHQKSPKSLPFNILSHASIVYDAEFLAMESAGRAVK